MSNPSIVLLAALLKEHDRNTCTHEDTHRGGVLWTICNTCGAKWADDQGGFKPHQDSEIVKQVRVFLENPSSRIYVVEGDDRDYDAGDTWAVGVFSTNEKAEEARDADKAKKLAMKTTDKDRLSYYIYPCQIDENWTDDGT